MPDPLFPRLGRIGLGGVGWCSTGYRHASSMTHAVRLALPVLLTQVVGIQSFYRILNLH